MVLHYSSDMNGKEAIPSSVKKFTNTILLPHKHHVLNMTLLYLSYVSCYHRKKNPSGLVVTSHDLGMYKYGENHA